MEEIMVRMPEKVFFSHDPKNYVVKNDFTITISKASIAGPAKTGVRKHGETYPSIYIRGLEQLFDETVWEDGLDSFLRLFSPGEEKEWSIRLGNFRNTKEHCAVICTTSDTLADEFVVTLSLSQRCAFSTKPVRADAITLEIYVDDFDSFFADVPGQLQYRITMERGFAVYIEEFGAYLGDTPVRSVPKGEECSISWKLRQDEKAYAALYDENGEALTNIPPHVVKIDRDKRFLLIARNDACTVMQYLNVYRTLWRKTDCEPAGIPKPDPKGVVKIYTDYGRGYYMYVHPAMYFSQDLVRWEIYASNQSAPEKFRSYSSVFASGSCVVCYLDEELLTVEMFDIYKKTWEEHKIRRHTGSYAFGLPPEAAGGAVRILMAEKGRIGHYELKGTTLINGRFMRLPAGEEVCAMDVSLEDGAYFMALTCENNCVYYYDERDDYRNNIFECSGIKDSFLFIVKSNARYICTQGNVFEAADREKFSDLHFFPAYEAGTRPILAGTSEEGITGFFYHEDKWSLWKYQFCTNGQNL